MGNQITYEGAAGVSGFHSKSWDVAPLVSANVFENNDIIVNGGELPRFRIGTRYRIGDKTLGLPGAQERGQELRSRLVSKQSTESRIEPLTCPPDVGPRAIDAP